jgi:hypothetical protein
MQETRTKTYYRPPIGRYEGLALIVRPEDQQPNTIYRPLVRIGKGVEPSEDPEERRRHKRIVISTLVAMSLIMLALNYCQ